MQLKRIQPLSLARTYTFYRIESTELVVHSELVFDVRRAKTDVFRFLLPKSSPASISIQGIGVSLKDYFSHEQGTQRQWTVQLSQAVGGNVKPAIDS